MGQLSRKLRNVEGGGLTYWCQGCKEQHTIYHGAGGGPRWEWNGDVERPTFAPSVLVRWNQAGSAKCCHTFIRDGMVQFLGDCTHEFAGQTLPLPDLPQHMQDQPDLA